MKRNVNIGLLLAIVVVVLGACTRPVVVVEDIPANTPRGSQIYITGEFNRWDPGDQRFRLKMDTDSNYYFELPSGFGTLQYKLTRGDWSTVETDICGYETANRRLVYGDEDTVYIRVESWRDLEPLNCPQVTIVIDNLPENTPEGDPIVIAGDFNEWTPDSSSVVKKDTRSGKYVFTMPRIGDNNIAEFLITRGDLFKVEADRFGNQMEKRQIRFGSDDTVYINIENWEDRRVEKSNRLTIILDRVPPENEGDKIFITGTFNGWFPRDLQFRFLRNENGKYQVSIPREQNEVQFKITRGDWSTEEVDILGYKKNNYVHTYEMPDTLHLEILGWLDRSETRHPTYTFVIDSLPPRTPPGEDIYMASSVNGWNAESKRFRFRENSDGQYYLTLTDAWRSFEYKITMGSWQSQEMDENGQIIPNRIFEYTGRDTVHITVKNWMHIPAFNQKFVVILLEKIPSYTPKSRDIYIAGTFNNWDPGNRDYILKKTPKGQRYITIPNWEDEIQFKFTLGSWDFEEQNAGGRNIDNRVYRFGYVDTLRLKVENWKGLE